MKEIKFRIYQPLDKKFYYWGFIEEQFVGIPTGAGLSIKECLEGSQQYTGAKDKNGNEIYTDVINDMRKLVPDLLEAGRKARDYLRFDKRYDEPTFDKLEQAIAKAEVNLGI